MTGSGLGLALHIPCLQICRTCCYLHMVKSNNAFDAQSLMHPLGTSNQFSKETRWSYPGTLRFSWSSLLGCCLYHFEFIFFLSCFINYRLVWLIIDVKRLTVFHIDPKCHVSIVTKFNRQIYLNLDKRHKNSI